jgi:hypothetical protein
MKTTRLLLMYVLLVLVTPVLLGLLSNPARGGEPQFTVVNRTAPAFTVVNKTAAPVTENLLIGGVPHVRGADGVYRPTSRAVPAVTVPRPFPAASTQGTSVVSVAEPLRSSPVPAPYRALTGTSVRVETRGFIDGCGSLG